MRRLTVLIAVSAGLLVGAPAASATTLYASPAGNDAGSNPCTSFNNPCTIERAVETVAGSTDDVALSAGTYNLSNQLEFPNAAITVHGDLGLRPTISVSAQTGPGYAVLVNGKLRDVNVEQTSTDPNAPSVAVQLSDSNDTVERVNAHITKNSPDVGKDGGRACELNGTVRDSVCWATGTQGIGARVSSGSGSKEANIRNVTAIATGTGGRGLQASAIVMGSSTSLNATNVIARGPGSGYDVETVGTSIVDLASSNYARTQSIGGRIDDDGGNETTTPVFRDQANGDFRQMPASTGTIDQGTSSNPLIFPAAGTNDLDGQNRQIDSAPDIGADELAHATAAALSCAPASLQLGSGGTNCTVTVTDTAGSLVPQGYVVFTSSGAGAFASGDSCALLPASATQAGCSVSYTPSAVGSGTHRVTAAYLGDTNHDGDQGAMDVGVTASTPPGSGGGGESGGGAGTGAGTDTGTTTTETGLRAAALKKCKKKRGAARRKCKRAANRLPV